MRVWTVIGLMGLGLALVCGGCGSREAATNEVVLYTAVDDFIVRPIVADFERQSGIKVILVTDAESTKTAALVQRLEAERDNPQADVWWGNEIFYTINLANKGILAPCEVPAMKEIPSQYQDPQHRWAATALRARVIGVSTADDAQNAVTGISSIRDLGNPKLRDRICMGPPVAGTVASHMAALYTVMGRKGFEAYLNELKSNGMKVVGGNSVAAQMVGQGTMYACLTDNDDVDATLREDGKIKAIVPDQGADGVGTLTIPCSAGLIAGARHPEAARKLLEYVLSRQVEQKLLEAEYAAFSVYTPAESGGVRSMDVKYTDVADNMKAAIELARQVLEGR